MSIGRCFVGTLHGPSDKANDKVSVVNWNSGIRRRHQANIAAYNVTRELVVPLASSGRGGDCVGVIDLFFEGRSRQLAFRWGLPSSASRSRFDIFRSIGPCGFPPAHTQNPDTQ